MILADGADARVTNAAGRILASRYTADGFAERYDAYRPSPPAALVSLLCGYARTDRLGLAVDLGSGTGLSARFWAPHAGQVVGVEPNAAMRAVAEQRAAAAGEANVT